MSEISVRDGVGGLIAYWRKARRMSQLALAGESGVSARHLSFLESGRAQPSRDMVLRLCEALRVPLNERNNLLLAAGFAPVFRESALDSPEMEEGLSALRLILRHHEPLPAVALDTRWSIVMANGPYAEFVNGSNPALLPSGPIVPLDLVPRPAPNVLRLLCHPKGFRRMVANWSRVTSTILARVAAEVRNDADEGRRNLLAEALGYPGVPPLPSGAQAAAEAGALIVPAEIIDGDGVIRYFSTIATLGTAQDITLRDLRIEMFHPVGPRDMERVLNRRGGDKKSPAV